MKLVWSYVRRFESNIKALGADINTDCHCKLTKKLLTTLTTYRSSHTLPHAPRMQNDSITAVENIFVYNANIGTFRWQHCGRVFNAWCALGMKNGPILETDLLDMCGYHVSVQRHISYGCPSYDESWLVDLQALTVWNRALLEELRGLQLVKKFLTFYGKKRIFTKFKRAYCLSLS